MIALAREGPKAVAPKPRKKPRPGEVRWRRGMVGFVDWPGSLWHESPFRVWEVKATRVACRVFRGHDAYYFEFHPKRLRRPSP